MAIDASKPTDLEFGSSHAAYIREVRQQTNDNEAAIGAAAYIPTQSDVDMTPGQATLIVGTHVADVAFEVVHINSATAETVDTMTFGTAGQIKIFIAEGNNVTIGHDGVNISLNGNDDLPMEVGDALTLVNVGGAGDGITDGTWWESGRVLRA